jgi:hypothetical protein
VIEMEMILKKKSFAPWVKKLSGWEVFAPLEKEGLWTYELAVDLKEIPPGYANTVGAPKKIIFPQREILFRFNTDGEGNPGIRETLPEKKDRVLFGVRPCDGRAVTLTDIVFGGDISDPYYARRRESVVLVGLACNTPPSSNCFCPTVGGSPHSTEGLDVLMTDLGDRYAVEAFTDRGRELVGKGGKLFVKATDKERKETAAGRPNPREAQEDV